MNDIPFEDVQKGDLVTVTFVAAGPLTSYLSIPLAGRTVGSLGWLSEEQFTDIDGSIRRPPKGRPAVKGDVVVGKRTGHKLTVLAADGKMLWVRDGYCIRFQTPCNNHRHADGAEVLPTVEDDS